jgi:uncharacterized membrane protein (DUF2068 family)
MSVESVHPPPQAPHHSTWALRTVAVYELVKGVLFLAIALGALSLVHKDLGEEAQNIVKRLHLDPAWHYSKVFIEESSKIHANRLVWFAATAGTFSVVRIVAGIGLWRERPWAEWFAVVSAALYVPIEIHHLIVRPSLMLGCVIAVNLAIVVYLSRLLLERHRKRAAAARKDS